MFYTFRQNNSGGYFVGPIAVCIEADSFEEAGSKAETVGLYFDGAGDCECCGIRWSSSRTEGNPEPQMYGEPLREYEGWVGEIPWRIYFKDGRMEEGERRA